MSPATGIATVKPIRIHVCQNVGIKIAELLNLPNSNNYKGQCWRGTAATFGADMGLNEIELQNITGHKNLDALRVYTAASSVQKLKASNALSLIPQSSSSSFIMGKENSENKKRKSSIKSVTVKKGRGNIEFILKNSSITNVNIQHQHPKRKNEEEESSDDEDDDEEDDDEEDDEEDSSTSL